MFGGLRLPNIHSLDLRPAARFARTHWDVQRAMSYPENRAWGLLWEYLTPEQRYSLERFGYFDEVKWGPLRAFHMPVRRRYRIYRDGRVKDWCVHPLQFRSLPTADRVLTMLVWIRYDEKRFLQIANWYPE